MKSFIYIRTLISRFVPRSELILAVLTTAVVLLGSATVSLAAPIKIDFAAKAIGHTPSMQTELPPGSMVTGSYTIESGTPDAQPGAPRLGLYNGAIIAMEMTAGGNTYTLDYSSQRVIAIEDNVELFDESIADVYHLRAVLTNGSRHYSVEIRIYYSGGQEWASDALPSAAPRIPTGGQWGSVMAEFSYPNFDFFAEDFSFSLAVAGPPVANAGSDLAVSEGAAVLLNGTGSQDTNSPALPITHAWTQLSGPAVALANASTATPSFTAPLVPSAGAALVFKLDVANSAGTSSDTVTINVANMNNPPVANAGSDQVAGENSVVTLDASQSSDADSEVLTMQWTQIAGPNVQLSGADTVSPTFTAPDVTAAQGTVDLKFQLVVNDGQVSSGPATVTIHVMNLNDAPTASAGPDQSVNELDLVTLDGSQSSDPDNHALAYQWIQIVGEPIVALTGADTAMPSFLAPELSIGGMLEGTTLTFQLTVSDGFESSTSTVNVRINNVNHEPIADAGEDQTVPEGTLVTLNGSDSADLDGDALTYAWKQIAGPSVPLAGADTANPTFIAPNVGEAGKTLRFVLRVDDGYGGVSSDDVIVNVAYVNQPPTVSVSGPVSVNEGRLARLSGSAQDPDGNPLTGVWTQVSGPTVILSASPKGTAGLNINFVAPQVTRAEADVVVRLTVSDGFGGSASSDITIHINNVNNVPVAQAPANLSVPEGEPVILVGQGTDPDAEEQGELVYVWTQTSGPAVQLISDGANIGFIAPMINSGDPTATLGLTFTLTVIDPNGASSSDDVEVSVTNEQSAPTAVAGGNLTANEGASVTLNGSASSDPDGDALSFYWEQISGPAVTLFDANTAHPCFTAPFVSAGGATLQFRLTVDDGYGGSSSDVATVTIANINEPPSITGAQPSLGTLWPPNHAMVKVSILGVFDPNNNAAITITGVTQDEPTNGLGDGDTAVDALINAGGTVLLRAERAGNGNGRVYHIHFTASDFEGSSSGVVTVSVPKSKKTDVAVDGGELHDSTR